MKKEIISGFIIGLAVVFSYTLSQLLPNIPMRISMSFIFFFGLISIVYLESKLFTGLLVNKTKELIYKENSVINIAKDLAETYIGNIIGVFIVFSMFKIINDPSLDTMMNIANAKINSNYLQVFINSILCNIMVCLSVVLSKKSNSDFGKIFLIIMCLAPMVFCGFEHCIANAFIFMVAININNSLNIIIHMILVSVGNIIGGIFITYMTER